jgi:hypothetical protein
MAKPPKAPTGPSSRTWIGVLVALLVLAYLGRSSSNSGTFALIVALPLGAVVVLLGVGRWHPRAPPFARQAAAWAADRPVVVAALVIVLGVALLGGIGGARSRSDAEGQRIARCADGRSRAHAHLADGNLDEAEAGLNVARETCTPAEQGEIAELDHDFSLKDATRQVVRQHEQREAEQKAAIEKEQQAVERWAASIESIRGKLKLAGVAASRGAWEDADATLKDAQGVLDGYAGTSPRSSKEWSDLSTQIAAVQKRIQPGLDRIAAAKAKREAEEAKARAAAEAIDVLRGPKPTCGGWSNGECAAVEVYLKRVMHDPDSYEHVESSPPVAQGLYWVVKSSFRGKNAFGAKVVNTKTFYIQQDQVVKVDD